MASSDRTPLPIYGVQHEVEFFVQDLLGAAVTGATFNSGLASGSGKAELRIDGDTAVNSTNSITESGGGWYRLLLTSAEQTSRSILGRAITTTSGALNTPFTSRPVQPPDIRVNLFAILGTTLTETVGGYIAAAFKKVFDVVSPIFTAASNNQTGDTFARVGANGAGLTSLAQASDMATMLTRLSSTRAAYLDNLSGGVTATQGDVLAINQSASRRVILSTVQQWERPETGDVSYLIELRSYSPDGAPQATVGDPTLAATGRDSGDVSMLLSAVTNPATGVYRWIYGVAHDAPLEWILFEAEAPMSDGDFTMSVQSQVCDFVAANWTTADQEKLVAIYDKLPFNNIADSQAMGETYGESLLARENTDAIAADIDALAIAVAALPGAGAIADAVHDEALSGHQTAGSAGKALTDAAAGGNPWSRLTVDNVTDGTFGKLVGELSTCLKTGTAIDGVALERVLRTLLAFVAGERPAVNADGEAVFFKQDGVTPQLTLTRGEVPGVITESVIAS